MKVKLEVDEATEDDEIIIRCKELTSKILNIQKVLSKNLNENINILFFKDNTEYYISLDEIIFFETEKSYIYGHSKDQVYEVRYKLYELEEILPNEFIRVSKSTIVNVTYINSIERNLTSSSIVNFQDTYKQTYVSRYYYKALKLRILEVRGYYEK